MGKKPNVGIAIMNNPPFITIFMGVMFTIKNGNHHFYGGIDHQKWVVPMALLYPHEKTIEFQTGTGMVSTGLRLNPADRENGLALLGGLGSSVHMALG